MIRRPPRSTRTDTLCPYTTLFRSFLERRIHRLGQVMVDDAEGAAGFQHRIDLLERLDGVVAAAKAPVVDVAECQHDVGAAVGHLRAALVREFGAPHRAIVVGLDRPPYLERLATASGRSEERCVGTVCGSTCRSRWA